MEAKFGYTPAEAVEMQTLMGDAIDNVPGIPGVGEKTAVKLIKKYGTAEAVLQAPRRADAEDAGEFREVRRPTWRCRGSW